MRGVVLAIIVVLIICLLYGAASYQLIFPFDGWTRESLGQFGDSWGGLTSLFSAAALCGVVLTIKIQMDSIKFLEKESQNQRKLDGIRDFETSFFNMLNLLQTIINDMTVVRDDPQFSSRGGRSVFLHFYKGFRVTMVKRRGALNLIIPKDKFGIASAIEKVGKDTSDYFENRSGNLSHYYRFLYNIYKYIDESGLEPEVVDKYASVLRAQISNYELLMLFYNAQTFHGRKFKKYLEKYRVLDNLPTEKLILDKHVFLIGIDAWGGNDLALKIWRR